MSAADLVTILFLVVLLVAAAVKLYYLHHENRAINDLIEDVRTNRAMLTVLLKHGSGLSAREIDGRIRDEIADLAREDRR